MDPKTAEAAATLAAIASPLTADPLEDSYKKKLAEVVAEVERVNRTNSAHCKDIERLSRTAGELRQDRDAWKRRAEEARARGPADNVVKDRDGLRLQVSKLMRQVADLEREVGLYREHANETSVKVSETRDRTASELEAVKRTFAPLESARNTAQAERDAALLEAAKAKEQLAKIEARLKTFMDAAEKKAREESKAKVESTAK